jgi:hypothetical protein
VKYTFIRKSSNRKTGPIPQTYNSRSTCPPSCAHYRTSCYAEDFYTRMAWDKVDRTGTDIDGLVREIARLPEGQLWRYSVAGDLPGAGEQVDAYELGQIVAANKGRRGFTYTHKKSAAAIKWARHAIAWGFTVNLSADDAGEADRLHCHGLPIVVTVPMDTPRQSFTPAGHPIIVCPAQTTEHTTCETCGLCQNASRRSIVGFRAHGSKARVADQRARKVIPIRSTQ